MECESCKVCPSCNYEGCYYCPDLAIMNDGKYVCVCSDAGKCAWKRIGDDK